MVQRLSPHLRCFDKYSKVLNDLLLPGKIFDLRGTDIILKLFICRGYLFLFALKIGIRHIVKLTHHPGRLTKIFIFYICMYKYNSLTFVPMKIADSKYSRCLYFTANALAQKIDKLAQESWSK